MPTQSVTSGAKNISSYMKSCLKVGFAVHLIGIFADLLMVIRVRCLNRKFRLFALVAVSVYTFLFAAWLLLIHRVRYSTTGKVCSGDFLDDGLQTSAEQYAIHQGRILRNIIIGVWCANGLIVVFAITADIIGKVFIKLKGSDTKD